MFKPFSHSFALLALVSPIAASAQVLPSPTPAAPGQTQNLSVQNGSKSSLAFGTNTSFGASLSTQSSAGMNAVIESTFVPGATTISSSIGAVQTNLGTTKATISNLKAQGGGDVPITGGSSLASQDASFASGNALLEGVSAKIDISLLGTDAINGGSRFSATVTPNAVGYDADSYAKCVSAANCLFSNPDGSKAYKDQQFANGNATALITSNTTVDIQTNQFASTFAQSF